jgi:hypothetical protein
MAKRSPCVRWLLAPLAILLAAGHVMRPDPRGGEAAPPSLDPVELFEDVFRPIEQAMGIDIKIGDLKLDVLSGAVSVGKVTVTHPGQGNFASGKGVHFPFAALAGLSDPSKCFTTVDKLNVKLDFTSDRFWKIKSPEAVPGAPDMKVGKVGIVDGNVRLQNGHGLTVRISDFSGSVKRLSLPGKLWSKGKVPSSRWVEAELTSGTVELTGIPLKLLLGHASFHFSSSVFHITQFEGTFEEGGRLTMAGEVNMTSGKPRAYDLVLKLDEVPIDRPGVTAVATGSLVVKGPAGKIGVGGKLDLDDVDTLRAAKWEKNGCNDEIVLAVDLSPGKDSQFDEAQLEGTICRGRIATAK